MEPKYSMQDAMDLAEKKVGVFGWKSYIWKAVVGGCIIEGCVP